MDRSMETNVNAGEVHAHIGVEAAPGTSGGSGGTVDQAKQKATQKASEVADQARQKADQLGQQAQQKAGQMADQARQKATETLNQAEQKLEQKTGIISKAQENPMAALGIAFGVGFLLAGSGDEEEKGGRGGKRRKKSSGAMAQLKGAVMGGISAAIAQEAKTLLREQGGQLGGLGETLSSFLGGEQSQSGARGTTTAGAPNRSTAGTTF